LLDVVMNLINEVLPRLCDNTRILVICRMVNEKTDIVVPCLVGVVVKQL
jgi:hypothetical protein